jgi:hypothetical protein
VSNFTLGINGKDAVVGYSQQSRHVADAYLRTKSGTVVNADPPNSDFAVATAVNDKNEATGDYDFDDGPAHGFVRKSDGTFETFDVGGDTEGTFSQAINASGWTAGYDIETNNAGHGFLRSPKGKITTFDAKGAHNTLAIALNSAGDTAGYCYLNETEQGFVRTASGEITVFSVKDAAETYPLAINDNGSVAGFYYDSKGGGHGFIQE